MASLTTNRSGWVLLYVDRDGKRRSFYPGKMPRKAAESVKRHLEQLLAAQKAHMVVPRDTVVWLEGCGQVMREKLQSHGLIDAPPEAKKSPTIEAFTRSYIDNRSDAKETTKDTWEKSRQRLLRFFDGNRPIESVTVGDAKDFRQWMLRQGRKSGKKGLAENTVRKTTSIAGQFFEDALDRKLVPVNPFVHKDLPRSVRENRSRDVFVSRENAEKILAACPDAEWRVIFALSRFGGLRCPSEHWRLRWSDVKWKQGRLVVTSPKTEHHEGRGSREIPLFPELRAELQALYDESEDKTGFVITRYRSSESTIRTMFPKIVRDAGLEPWPKLFHNMRATRETELAAEFPLHVVCNWIGNSVAVASRNYLQVRAEDFDRAATPSAHHIAHQHTPAGVGNGMQGNEAELTCEKKNPREQAIPLGRRDSAIRPSWTRC